MRRLERIDKFLSLIDNGNLLLNIWKICSEVPDDAKMDYHALKTLIGISGDKISKEWHENPDWRYSQVLVNSFIIPNYPGFWYYMEENEILEAQGVDPAEYLLWGVNFDKDMNKLPITEYKFICDLNTDHIQAILDGNWTGNAKYLETFKNELNRRNE